MAARQVFIVQLGIFCEERDASRFIHGTEVQVVGRLSCARTDHFARYNRRKNQPLVCEGIAQSDLFRSLVAPRSKPLLVFWAFLDLCIDDAGRAVE